MRQARMEEIAYFKKMGVYDKTKVAPPIPPDPLSPPLGPHPTWPHLSHTGLLPTQPPLCHTLCPPPPVTVPVVFLS